MTVAVAVLATAVLALQPAQAFTFENPGGGATNQNGTASGDKSGYVDIDPTAALPPIGESLPGMRYNEGPGAYNNGLASPPDPRSSVGPSWLYGR
jgi:hypothetical protein